MAEQDSIFEDDFDSGFEPDADFDDSDFGDSDFVDDSEFNSEENDTVNNNTEENGSTEDSFEDGESFEDGASFEDGETFEDGASFEDGETFEDGGLFDDESIANPVEEGNTLNFDEEPEKIEDEPEFSEEDMPEKPKMSAEAKREYDAAFDGEEQLEHSLFSLSSKLKITTEMIKLENLIPSNFKKQSRTKTIIGLNGTVSQWGVINPVHVMKLEDDDCYLILDGLRRVYAAMKCGMKEVECRIWDFEDKVEGKKLANVISLMINRSERFRPAEQWNMLQILEDVNDLSPTLLEYLLQLDAGQAMKLKDVMLCELDYVEIRDKLLDGELDIESAYKKLCNERKKENRLQRDDNTAIENTIADIDEVNKQAENRRLSDDEVHDLLELANTNADGKDMSELDMTDEIRGSDKFQTTDERHPVDPAIRQGTFIRDDFHCRCCGVGGVQWLGVLVFHHAVPVYAGGPDTIDNGLTLCQNCHMTLHNYIQGKVQVQMENLSESQKTTFKNIFKYGNIALSAVKSKGIKRSDLAALDKTGTQHAYPDAHIKENTIMYNQAQLNRTTPETSNEDVEEESIDELLENNADIDINDLDVFTDGADFDGGDE